MEPQERRVVFTEMDRRRLEELRDIGDVQVKKERKVLFPWMCALCVFLAGTLFVMYHCAITGKADVIWRNAFIVLVSITAGLAVWLGHRNNALFQKAETEFLLTPEGKELERLLERKEQAGRRMPPPDEWKDW